MNEPGSVEGELRKHNPLLLTDKAHPRFDEGELPTGLEEYRHKMPWPLQKTQTGIYLAAFHGGPDYVIKDRLHEGIDVQVSAGTPIECIEDGQIAYGVDDERGNFGNILIQGNQTHIMYRYCHLDLDSLPWDWKSLWEDELRPMVKAGDVIGKVSDWFRELPEELEIPQEVEAIHGRKRDHLHLETEYNPHLWASKEYMNIHPVGFNPLLVLQKPEDFFRK